MSPKVASLCLRVVLVNLGIHMDVGCLFLHTRAPLPRPWSHNLLNLQDVNFDSLSKAFARSKAASSEGPGDLQPVRSKEIELLADLTSNAEKEHTKRGLHLIAQVYPSCPQAGIHLSLEPWASKLVSWLGIGMRCMIMLLGSYHWCA